MHLALTLLRRLGLALGAYIAAYNYFNSTSMRSTTAHSIALGLALFFFSLPRLDPPRHPRAEPRGFEVVVPDKAPD